MPTRPRVLLPNACYHIYARGNQKQKVFICEDDCSFFVSLLKGYKKRYGFFIYGYCLMPNHIHLLGQPREVRFVAKFMQGLLRAYTAYFNGRYEKVGHLWQGRFKSKIIANDGYLVDCVHYIEHNPVRAQITKTAAEYRWCSYKERVMGRLVNGRIVDEINQGDTFQHEPGTVS